MAKHVTYADAGVDVDEGARAVDAIKSAASCIWRISLMIGIELVT